MCLWQVIGEPKTTIISYAPRKQPKASKVGGKKGGCCRWSQGASEWRAGQGQQRPDREVSLQRAGGEVPAGGRRVGRCTILVWPCRLAVGQVHCSRPMMSIFL